MSDQPAATPEQPTQLNVKRSVEIGKLVTALCKAQLAFDPIYKESENPAFKRGNRVSKYADLFSLVTATRKHLNANGLTLMQFPTVTLEGKNLVVTTMLAHESGEWISHELLIPATDDRGFTAHSIGKAMTYARRYSWQSITGAVAEDDDDGNEVSGQGTHEAAQDIAKRKIEAGRQGKDVNAPLEAAKAQEMPSEGPSQLICYPIGDGWYEVTGDSEVMEANKGLLLLYGKRKGREKIVQMEAGQLDTFRHEFCEVRGNLLSTLKERNA